MLSTVGTFGGCDVRINRYNILLFIFFFAFGSPSSAHAFDDPRELVENIYASYSPGQDRPDLSQYYSTTLQHYFDRYEEKLADEATSEIVFDPFVSAENALLNGLNIGEPTVRGNRAIVNVTFDNFDHPTMLTLSLVREADGWKVDDVVSLGSEEHWLLTWALVYDPFGQ